MQTRLTLIEKSIHNHFYLDDTDYCYFFGTYTPRKGYSYSDVNNLILNFKKTMDFRSNSAVWKYKLAAIDEIYNRIIQLIEWSQLKDLTWIPIPPSKSKNHNAYDDRLIKVLQKIQENFRDFDYRDIFECKQDRVATHSGSQRQSPEEHINNWIINEDKLIDLHQPIVIFDDVITTGASFKAAKQLLTAKNPDLRIIGLFIARDQSEIESYMGDA